MSVVHQQKDQFISYWSSEEEKEREAENLFRNNGLALLTSEERSGYPINEAHKSPNKVNLKRSSSRDVIIKLTKIKHRIFKAAREKKSCNLELL